MGKKKKRGPYIIDTNVPVLAGTNIADIPEDQLPCAEACVRFIENILRTKDFRIVLDANWEILNEYKKNIMTPKGSENLGTRFLMWLYQHLGQIPDRDCISLEKTGDHNYVTFPIDPALSTFDPSDRKFVALANAHPEHPAIVQGTDGKWWGFKDVLENLGIHIEFLCEEYVEQQYLKKIGN